MADCEKNIWNKCIGTQKETDCVLSLDFDGSLMKGLITKVGEV